jgi:hypothetical protein
MGYASGASSQWGSMGEHEHAELKMRDHDFYWVDRWWRGAFRSWRAQGAPKIGGVERAPRVTPTLEPPNGLLCLYFSISVQISGNQSYRMGHLGMKPNETGSTRQTGSSEKNVDCAWRSRAGLANRPNINSCQASSLFLINSRSIFLEIPGAFPPSKPGMGSVSPHGPGKVAASQYPGCFTDEEVGHLLGHPSRSDEAVNNDVQDVSHGGPGRTATPENHYLPDCHCSTLHFGCGAGTVHVDAEQHANPLVINMTMEYLRYAAGRGCWFCSVVYGGIVAAPPWDPLRAETVPIHPLFQMPRDRQPSDTFDFAFQPFRDNDRTQEPDLVFYVDKDQGIAHPPPRPSNRKTYPG